VMWDIVYHFAVIKEHPMPVRSKCKGIWCLKTFFGTAYHCDWFAPWWHL